MRILTERLNNGEKKFNYDLLIGCINRICVSDDKNEIIRKLGFANTYLSMLAQDSLIRIDDEILGEKQNEI